jgi:diaminohydroxyphosphoribosylaminopyrimidine deaminase/5-amino-6-(5-phosphoribosylamino)uracil reductase
MRRAIAISAQGLGSTSPNPPVGCVILDSEGRTVGEGYHVRKGESHAEVNALNAAGKQAEGGTAVVTLEPCNHYGRTPPCREALLNAGVAKVLISVMDPTSRGEGGAALLRKSGVEVEQDFLKDEALLVLGPWQASLSDGRPFITWIYEASADGKPVFNSAQDITLGEVDTLRRSYDLVVNQEGGVEEGDPGSHAEDLFQLPHGALGERFDEMAKALRGAGVRSVLLSGVVGDFSRIASAGMVDQVISYLPHTSPSRSPGEEVESTIAVPDGYRLTEVVRMASHVRLAGRRA